MPFADSFSITVDPQVIDLISRMLAKQPKERITIPEIKVIFTYIYCIKIKINLNFYFYFSLWCLKRFFDTANKCENKNKLIFSLHPRSGREGLTLFFPISLLIPLKTSENLWFSNVFRGIKREHWEEKG